MTNFKIGPISIVESDWRGCWRLRGLTLPRSTRRSYLDVKWLRRDMLGVIVEVLVFEFAFFVIHKLTNYGKSH